MICKICKYVALSVLYFLSGIVPMCENMDGQQERTFKELRTKDQLPVVVHLATKGTGDAQF